MTREPMASEGRGPVTPGSQRVEKGSGGLSLSWLLQEHPFPCPRRMVPNTTEIRTAGSLPHTPQSDPSLIVPTATPPISEKGHWTGTHSEDRPLGLGNLRKGRGRRGPNCSAGDPCRCPPPPAHPRSRDKSPPVRFKGPAGHRARGREPPASPEAPLPGVPAQQPPAQPGWSRGLRAVPPGPSGPRLPHDSPSATARSGHTPHLSPPRSALHPQIPPCPPGPRSHPHNHPLQRAPVSGCAHRALMLGTHTRFPRLQSGCPATFPHRIVRGSVRAQRAGRQLPPGASCRAHPLTAARLPGTWRLRSPPESSVPCSSPAE